MKRDVQSVPRKGVALVMALVVMAALAVVLSVVTLQIVSQRQLVRQRQRQLQAEWLARAGVELAAARLLEKPAGFVEETAELLPDTKVRIVVEKLDQDSYTVSVEAEVGPAEDAVVVRTASARFRRTDSDGVIRLQAVPLDKKNKQ
jgi:hypothetical protein